MKPIAHLARGAHTPILVCIALLAPAVTWAADAEELTQWRASLDRKDVAAGIGEVGRREQQPIYTILD